MKVVKKILKGLGIVLGSLLVILVLFLTLFGGMDLLASGDNHDEEMTRTEALSHLQELEAIEDKNDEQRIETAFYQYYIGDFESSLISFKKLVDEGIGSFEVHSMLSEVYYLTGDYAEAERIMLEQMKQHPININVQLKAQVRLLKIYYQTNQYQKVKSLHLASIIGLGDFKEWMLSFEEEPYQMLWPEESRAEVSMLKVDPLPVVEVIIDGETYYFLIDTGGDALIVDQRESQLFEEQAGKMKGEFAGGIESDLLFTKIKELSLGELTLKNVPVMSIDLSHFDSIMTPEYLESMDLPIDTKIAGIIGTKIFQQALCTVDYIDQKLILRKQDNRIGDTAKVLMDEGRNILIEKEFYLSETHIIVAKGNFMDQPVMFWLDSGYASDNAVLADRLTFEDFGIALPEMIYNEHALSGGGLGYKEGELKNYGTAGIGSETMTSVGVGYDEGETMYWESDFIIEGMLSHAYLKQYAWTLDFQEHKMYLTK